MPKTSPKPVKPWGVSHGPAKGRTTVPNAQQRRPPASAQGASPDGKQKFVREPHAVLSRESGRQPGEEVEDTCGAEPGRWGLLGPHQVAQHAVRTVIAVRVPGARMNARPGVGISNLGPESRRVRLRFTVGSTHVSLRAEKTNSGAEPHTAITCLQRHIPGYHSIAGPAGV